METLVSAWNAVSTETIVNCFRKAGISNANQETVIDDEDNPFKDWQNENDALQKSSTTSCTRRCQRSFIN